jgi:MEMO1 family protein
MKSVVRQPAVAGRFYPGTAAALEKGVRSYLLTSYLPTEKNRIAACGCIVPHAGYMYSGHIAGSVFATLDLPRHILILGPNHTGLGLPLAIMSQGAWETPLGRAEINSSLAHSLLKKSPLLEEDEEAHRAEHAIEVQLPFLQILRPDFSFVPITVGTSQIEVLTALGKAIAEVIAEQAEPILMISSSDMNHYENDVITRVKDSKATEKILALDAQGLADTVRKEKISMCGIWPTFTMLIAASHLGANNAAVVKYATSGDISGDHNMVVGYAGMVIT